MKLISVSVKLFHSVKGYIFIAIFFSAYLFSLWFKNQNLVLDEVKNGIIGIATLDMSDISARVSLYYKSLTILCGLFFLGLPLLAIVKKTRFLSNHDLLLINYLSAGGVIFFILTILMSSNDNSITFILMNIALIVVFAIFRKLFSSRNNALSIYQLMYLAIVSFCLSSFSSAVAELAQKDLNLIFNKCYLFFTSLLLLIFSWTKPSAEKFKRVVYMSRPLFVLPLITFLAVEVYLILNQRNFFIFSPKPIYAMGVFFLVIYYFILSYSLQKKEKLPTVKNQLNHFAIPFMLLSMSFYVFYKPIIDKPQDMFELANSANAMMRSFDFGEIPVLETFSSHLLSDQLHGYLYFALNGYNHSTDFLIYQFFYSIIYILVIYYFLLRITGSGMFSLFAIVFYPFIYWVLPEIYILSVLSIFLLYNLLKEYSFKNLLYIFLYSLFLLLWKVDLGVANALSIGCILVLYLIIKFNKGLVKDYFKCLLYIGIPSLIFIILLSFFSHISLFTNFKQAWSYIGAGQAHGYSTLAYNTDKYYYIHYFLFPVVALAMLIYTVYKFFSNEKNEKKLFGNLSLIYCILFYFANAQRGLVRHSFIENQDVFISSFIYFIVPYFIIHFFLRQMAWKYYFIMIFSAVIISSYSISYQKQGGFFYDFENSFSLSHKIYPSTTQIQRTTVSSEFEKKNYLALKEFFDKNFDKDATFIDFSNTPMLYFYLNRRVPSYFNQYMQNTVTAYLQEENINYLQKFNIPIVIYSYVPEQWWDNTDNVPNPLRYHVISNYIHNNYEPLTVLNEHYVWIKKGIQLNKEKYPALDSSLIEKQSNYELRNLAFLLGKDKEGSESKIIMELPVEKNDTNSFIVSKPFSRAYGNNVDIIIDNPGEQVTATLTYSGKGKALGTFTFFLPPNTINQKYRIPVSTQWNWHHHNPEVFTLNFSSGTVDFKKAVLCEGGI